MPAPLVIAPAVWPDDREHVRELLLEYAASLGFGTCFDGFDAELESLPGAYGPPLGAMLLARTGERPIGEVGLRPRGEEVCEMKRLYVRPDGRGMGVGRALALAIVAEARRLGYRRMVLDTLEAMTPAIGLYRSLGFAETEPYHQREQPTRFFDLRL
jgi:putative acetyltransferase